MLSFCNLAALKYFICWKMKRILFVAFIFIVAFSCKKNSKINQSTVIKNTPVVDSTAQIKNVPVSFAFNLNDPLYNKLNFSGSWQYLDGFGVRGIILTNFGGVIFALERDCPYNPNDSCSTVTVQTNSSAIICGKYDIHNNWLPCCNSQFKLDGTLQSGPSLYPLKKYKVSQDQTSGSVTISN